MKGYNFMISDNRLHKTRFCKKRGANQNCPHKEGVGAKEGGGLERFHILRGRGGVGQKEGVTLAKKRRVIPWCPLCIRKVGVLD